MKQTKSSGKAGFVVINSIRIALLLTFFIGFYSSRKLVLVMSIIGLLVTYVPFLLRKLFNFSVPKDYQIISILFIYGILVMADLRGVFSDFWWWGAFVNFLISIALGFIGITFFYFITEKSKATPISISFFAFCFSLSIMTSVKLFEFFIDSIFGFSIQESSREVLVNLSFALFGAIMVSLAGYLQLKSGKDNPISEFIFKIMEKTNNLFRTNSDEEEIMEIIKKGENEKIEFKSSLRTNLHTKEIDPRIEQAILKTVSAYLNTNGGILLVGVSDSGEIIGLDIDKFQNKDKLSLHFTNLIKKQIGNEYLPFIRYEIIEISGKPILKVECKESEKYVFLKNGQEEEFYVRNGPASVKISGSSLINYIKNKFGRK